MSTTTTAGYSSTVAWAALQSEMATHEPACAGDDRFTDDKRSTAITEDLAAICAACPVLDACRRYATTARPHKLAGYWGMKWRGKVAE
ncbi:MAG: WhiB family transcriptional regulator [Candidatus Microbacterium colombiense]|nr:MAG: WhiB family transcriptional regulator [Microbacterium sp.]